MGEQKYKYVVSSLLFNRKPEMSAKNKEEKASYRIKESFVRGWYKARYIAKDWLPPILLLAFFGGMCYLSCYVIISDKESIYKKSLEKRVAVIADRNHDNITSVEEWGAVCKELGIRIDMNDFYPVQKALDQISTSELEEYLDRYDK